MEYNICLLLSHSLFVVCLIVCLFVQSGLEEQLGCWSEGSCIGEVVLRQSDALLRVYPPFVNFFDMSKEALQRCDRMYPRFHAFLKVSGCGFAVWVWFVGGDVALRDRGWVNCYFAVSALLYEQVYIQEQWSLSVFKNTHTHARTHTHTHTVIPHLSQTYLNVIVTVSWLVW